MQTVSFRIFSSLILLVAIAGCLAINAQAKSDLSFNSCELSTLDGRGLLSASCANWNQPINPDDAESTQIDLFVVKVNSVSPNPNPDPLLIINGGPGGSSVDLLIDLAGANVLKRILNKRDIIVMDQRGTGRSSSLACPALADNQIQITNTDLKLLTKECLAQLSHDPRYFSTAYAVQDIENLRITLGKSRLNVYGVSYGTRVAVEYARQFEESTRTLILDGVVPPTIALGPDVAIKSQDALNLVFQQCRESVECDQAFPNLEKSFWNVIRRLEKKPVVTEFRDPRSGESIEIQIEKEHLALVIRMSLYNPELRSLLPFLIHEASSKNDFSRVAASATQLLDQLGQSISNGMHNAVACTEDVPFYDKQQRLARDSKDTYMGSDFHESLMEICSEWPVGSTNESMKKIFTSKTPSLILSGQYDPVTPPSYAEQLAANLENRLHIVGEGQGHGLISRGCIPKVISDFLEDPILENLKTECVKHLKPVPFFVNAYGPSP